MNNKSVMFKKQIKYNFSNIISEYKGRMIAFLSILLIFTFSIITLNVTAAPDNELTYHGKLTDATLDTAVAKWRL